MGEEEYVKKTQETLGTIVKKPPLTEKLLAKPPFRFLHDIITNVIKTTGFMDGLYTEAELDSAQVSDKEKKIAFLQKAIDLVQMVNGQTVLAKPSKIVAGQEPDKTNELLQQLAAAVQKEPNSKEYVKRVLNGEKGDANSAGSNKENKKRSTSKEKTKEESAKSKDEKAKTRSSSKDEKERTSSSKEAKEEGSSAKQSKREKSADRGASKDKESKKDEKKSRDDEGGDKKTKEKKSSEAKKEKSSDDLKVKKPSKDSSEKKESKKRDSDKVDNDKEKKHKSKKTTEDKQGKAGAETNGVDDNEVEQTKKIDKKEKLKIDLSSKPTTEQEETAALEDGLMDSPKPFEGRRGSIIGKDGRSTLSAVDGRKEAVQLEDDGTLVKPGLIRQTRSARPATASSTVTRPGTAAGRPASMKIETSNALKRKEIVIDDKKLSRKDSIIQDAPTGKVITEMQKNGVDEDDNFIVDDSGPSAIDGILNDQPDDVEVGVGEVDERDDHGQLVRKILETKKGLEAQKKGEGKSNDKTVVVYDAKEREKAKVETQKLQELVQHLTRNSHPLGKIVDFLQEDVDSMLKELQQWRNEYKTNMANVRQEMNVTGGQLEPLKSKLNELDQQIIDQFDAITALRGRTISNEEKIQKMLNAMSKK